MEHLEKLKTPILPTDPMIAGTRDVIEEREATVTRLRNDLAALEVEDTADFLDIESPRALERRAQRLRLNAELHQATASLDGAKAFLTRREAMFMYRSVRALREQIESEIEQARVLALEVGASNVQSVSKLNRMLDVTEGIVQKLQGVRGRNMLTGEGHIAYSSVREIANQETLQFWMIRHFSGMLGWRTAWGPGPDFGEAAGSAITQTGQSIEALLGDENFDAEIVKAVEDEDAASTEVALVNKAGG